MQSYLYNKSSSSFSYAKLQIIFVLSKKKSYDTVTTLKDREKGG